MGLPRTFVGFSSTDILSYRLMLAWKEHQHIDFDFTNCQLGQEINSEDETYIKRRCRERIAMCRIPDDHKDAYETGLAENRTSPS